MAEDTVVKEVLTDKMIDAGEALVRELDRRRWPVEDALWLYESDGNRWQLAITSPNLEIEGPQRCYEMIREAVESLPEAKLAIGFLMSQYRRPPIASSR
jgi:hypothetical protein